MDNKIDLPLVKSLSDELLSRIHNESKDIDEEILFYNTQMKTFIYLDESTRLPWIQNDQGEWNQISRGTNIQEVLKYCISILSIKLELIHRQDEEVKRRIIRKLDHHKRRLSEKVAQNGDSPLSEHGGRQIGYFEGRISLMEDLLEEINEIKTTH